MDFPHLPIKDEDFLTKRTGMGEAGPLQTLMGSDDGPLSPTEKPNGFFTHEDKPRLRMSLKEPKGGVVDLGYITPA